MYHDRRVTTYFVSENCEEVYWEEDFPEVKVEHQVKLPVDSYLMF